MPNPYYSPNLAQQFSNASSGFAAGEAGGNPNQFYMDGAGVLGSAASGYATGGPIGAVVGGVTTVFKQDAALKRNINNVNTSFNGMTDIYGRPVYDSSEFAQGFSDFRGLTEATRPGAHAMMPRRRRQAERKTRDLYNGIIRGQQNFNRAESNFQDQAIQRDEFMERMNSNRYRNLYQY